MAKTTVFDVLIVYSDRTAISANIAAPQVLAPFPLGTSSAGYNVVYGYFLATCRKNKLSAALTTSADISGAGRCRSYWLFKSNRWLKVKKAGYSMDYKLLNAADFGVPQNRKRVILVGWNLDFWKRGSNIFYANKEKKCAFRI